MQAFARGIDADRAEVVFDPNLNGDRGVLCQCRAKVLFQGGFDPLAGGFVVVNLGLAAGDFDLERNVLAQHIAPREFPRPFVELGKVHHPKRPDPHQNSRGPAQLQVCTPDIRPCSAKTHPAHAGDGIGKARRDRFFSEDCFEARSNRKEDV